MKIGAHVSTVGGYAKAVKRVAEIGGNCLQIFSTSPRGWRPANLDDGDLLNFKEATEKYSVYPTYFHASYLINLAGSKEVQEKSVNSMIAELRIAGRFKIAGTVVHLGSFKIGKKEDEVAPLFETDKSAYEVLFKNIKEILKETPEETLFVIENMGMRKIGKSIEEIAFIIEKINSPRIKVCLDTCHLHAAGEDLSTNESLEGFLERFESLIGASFLELIHINDSRDSLGFLRDRHENIGDGKIPKEVFSLMLNHPKMKNLPFITEVPGLDGKGPDKENLDRIKSMVLK